jgi:hypothetical protein
MPPGGGNTAQSIPPAASQNPSKDEDPYLDVPIVQSNFQNLTQNDNWDYPTSIPTPQCVDKTVENTNSERDYIDPLNDHLIEPISNINEESTSCHIGECCSVLLSFVAFLLPPIGLIIAFALWNKNHSNAIMCLQDSLITIFVSLLAIISYLLA